MRKELDSVKLECLKNLYCLLHAQNSNVDEIGSFSRFSYARLLRRYVGSLIRVGDRNVVPPIELQSEECAYLVNDS